MKVGVSCLVLLCFVLCFCDAIDANSKKFQAIQGLLESMDIETREKVYETVLALQATQTCDELFCNDPDCGK